MGLSSRPKVKICCIKSAAEAKMAIEAGANVLGLVGNMPSGPGVISDEQIKEILQMIPGGVETFLLTSETSSQGIIAHHKRAPASALQIVDELKKGSYAEIREALPGIKLVQVLHILDEKNIAEAVELSNKVDFILLDSGNPNLEVKELGGTGRTHNWEISRQIVKQVSVPVFLAGGLKVSNVSRAIEEVGSYGLDLCSGVRDREKDQLDSQKLRAFFDKVNQYKNA